MHKVLPHFKYHFAGFVYSFTNTYKHLSSSIRPNIIVSMLRARINEPHRRTLFFTRFVTRRPLLSPHTHLFYENTIQYNILGRKSNFHIPIAPHVLFERAANLRYSKKRSNLLHTRELQFTMAFCIFKATATQWQNAHLGITFLNLVCMLY